MEFTSKMAELNAVFPGKRIGIYYETKLTVPGKFTRVDIVRRAGHDSVPNCPSAGRSYLKKQNA